MNEKDIVLHVEEIIEETNDTITIVFKADKPVVYSAGQFLMLKIPFYDKILHRAYSLSSSSHIGDSPAITIKRVKGGKISNYLLDIIQPGHKIISSLPQGNFTVDLHKLKSRDLIFIGAGSGITPLMSQIKAAIMLEPRSNIKLIYGNRNQQSIIFESQLRALESAFSDRFSVKHILSQPEPGWGGLSGRINDELLKRELEDILINNYEDDEERDKFRLSNARFMLCGPVGLMKSTTGFLQSYGIDKDQILFESFGDSLDLSGTTLHNNQAVKVQDESPSDVKINFEGEEYNLKVSSDETILEVALDNDIDLPFACNSGTCNVCMAKCTKGSVRMEADDGLTDEEKEEKYILTCVSHPDSRVIEIEYE